nr:reverse transcriptase domain-containing protein [Tanacetum cinerariifolium]
MRTRSSSNLVVESSHNPATLNPKRRNRRRSKQPFSLEESPLDTMADQRTMAELLRTPIEGYAEAIVVPPILAEHFELKHSLINMMTSDQFFGLEKHNLHDHTPDQDSLNSAIGGNLLERRTQDVLTIIENKSKCLAANGNTFLEFRDNIQGYVSAAAVNYTQGNFVYRPSSVANEIQPPGKLKAITTQSGLVLDGPSFPMPPPFINLEEDERIEETLTDLELVEYTIKVPPPIVQTVKPPSQRNYVVHERVPRHPHITYPLRMNQEKQQEKDEIQIHKFWQMFKQLHINITLADALILIMKYQKLLKALLSNKEKLLELENTPLNENCLAVILKKLPEKLGDPGKFLISCCFSEIKCKALADLVINPLSGNTTSSSPDHLLEEFADELALITFPLGNDDHPFDIESNLREIEYLLNHDPTKEMDSILEDSVDECNLTDLNNHLSDNDDVYDDPFDSKEDKIKESKLLIDELDPPRSSYFHPSLEYDSILYEDFSEVDALPSTNNEDKVFNAGILIHEILFKVTIRVTPDKNVKKISISNVSLILEDFNPPLYELSFHKEVLGSETLLSFSSENEEKVFNPRILTSKGVHTSLLSKLSHLGPKAFKVIKNFESPMEIFPCSYREDIRILDVPSLLSNKEKLLELENTPLNENCSAVILKKLPEKLGDPGKFLISCCFSELKCKTLADLGASINLMPLSVWKKLDSPELISTRITLKLANQAICTPIEIAKDIFVLVGKFTFPADFFIVDCESDPRVPLILGRLFLRTACALIDVHGEEIILRDVINPLSGNTTSSSPDHLLEEFADELALITFPLGNDDHPFDIESDLREIEYLLNHDPTKEMDSILEDSVDECILIHENLFKVTIRVTPDKNVKKISISNASLILEDFNPPIYELSFHKEVLGSETLLSFSSKNEEKVFNPRILTSKGVHTSLLSKLSHRGPKAFKVIKIFESPMEIFPCSYGEDIRILDVPCLHFDPP